MNRFVFVFLACLIAYATASSHSEAPGTARLPNSDISDFYVFRSYETGKENYVIFILNAYPLQNPFGGPNYFTISDEHYFEIYVDNNGDAQEDITFQFYFGSRLGGQNETYQTFASDDLCAPNQTLVSVTQHSGFELNIGGKMIPVALKLVGPITPGSKGLNFLNWFEFYRINYIVGSRDNTTRTPITTGGGRQEFVKPFDYAGTKSFPDYEAYAQQFIYSISIPNCGTNGRVFVGQRREAFFIKLGGVFDLVNFVPIVGAGFPNQITECNIKNNDLKHINVHSIALEVPISCITNPASQGVIGSWAAVRQLIHQGSKHVPGVQVARLGQVLVNELVIGLRDKGLFNAFQPITDAQYFLDYVEYPTLPEIINILFLDAVNQQLGTNLPTIAPTNLPRTDLVVAFLTGVPTINQFPGQFTPCEYIRLNTSIPPTPRASQSRYGVAGGDVAGFPNGRRVGDDTVDIALMVMMGRLCYLGLPTVFGCSPSDAVAGNFTLSDGAPVYATDFPGHFPFMNTPVPGAVTDPDPSFCPSDHGTSGTSYYDTAYQPTTYERCPPDQDKEYNAAAGLSSLAALFAVIALLAALLF